MSRQDQDRHNIYFHRTDKHDVKSMLPDVFTESEVQITIPGTEAEHKDYAYVQFCSRKWSYRMMHVSLNPLLVLLGGSRYGSVTYSLPSYTRVMKLEEKKDAYFIYDEKEEGVQLVIEKDSMDKNVVTELSDHYDVAAKGNLGSHYHPENSPDNYELSNVKVFFTEHEMVLQNFKAMALLSLGEEQINELLGTTGIFDEEEFNRKQKDKQNVE